MRTTIPLSAQQTRDLARCVARWVKTSTDAAPEGEAVRIRSAPSLARLGLVERVGVRRDRLAVPTRKGRRLMMPRMLGDALAAEVHS